MTRRNDQGLIENIAYVPESGAGRDARVLRQAREDAKREADSGGP
jgi:hypothetical protein